MPTKYTVRVKYFNDFSDPSRPEFVTEILNGEGTQVLAQFLPDSCILKLFKWYEKNPVTVIDEKNPLDVLDLGLAQLVHKGDKASDDQEGGVVTMTHVAGHGVETLVFLFETTKKAQEWCYVVNGAQNNLGLDAPRAEDATVSEKNKYYCADLSDFADEFGVRAEEVLLEKIAAVQQKREELQDAITADGEALEKKTAQIQSRDFQIKLKEKEVDRLKAEQEALRPSHQYKYIIPYKPEVPQRFSHTARDSFSMCNEQDCEKLAERRASVRATQWKIYDQSNEIEVMPKDVLHLAKLDLAKHGGRRSSVAL